MKQEIATKKFSIIIPIYNEERAIHSLYFSLKATMDSLKQSYEIIFVNDGSRDRSLEMLNNINLEQSNLVIVNLSKHSGQSIAMQAGFDIAQGELIITMDGDLQYDSVDIPKLLNKINEGYDVICGWRRKRKDSLEKVLLSKIFANMRRIVFKEKIHDPGCTFRVFKRDILKNIFLFSGVHRFFTLITLKLGYKIGEIEVEHYHRRFGHSKYNVWNRLPEVVMVLIQLSLFDIYKLMKRNFKLNLQYEQIHK